MKFEVRKLNSTDYDSILTKWWKNWRWTSPPKDFLPENGLGGYIIYDGDIPVVAGFLYITNSNVAWVDWVVSNLEYKNKKNRKIAIETLISSLEIKAKELNKNIMYALVKNQSLINTYVEMGYIQGDAYNTELIKRI